MYLTGLANKVRSKLLKNPVAIYQNVPEALNIFPIIGRVMTILIERSRIIELHRLGIDLHIDAQRTQARHVLGVEIGYRSREQPDGMMRASAGFDQKLVRHQ